MMKRTYFVLILLLINFLVSPFRKFSSVHAEDFFSMGVGAGFFSQRVYRGALIWDAPFLIPLLELRFGQLSVRGPSLLYQVPLENESWQLSVSTEFFNDNKGQFPMILISKRDQAENYRNQRDSSLGLTLSGQYFFKPKKSSVQLTVSRDFIRYHGLYVLLGFSLPILPFTRLELAQSWAEPQHNRYVYGPTAEGGLAHARYGLRNVLPFIPGGGVLISSLSYHFINRQANQQADYIRDEKANWVFDMFLSWRI